jgi:hypothetical protein
MKNKILLMSLLAMAISHSTQAEYVLNIPLEGKIIQFQKPDASVNLFDLSQDTLSVGDSATLTWNIENAESVLLNGESVSKNSGSKSITFDTPGSFSFQLKTTSLSGATAYSDSKTVNVYSLASIDFFNTSSTVVDEGQSATLSFATAGSFKNTINGVDMGNNTTYVVTPSDKTDYTLIAENQIGRITSKSLTVLVQKWSSTTPVYGTWADVNGRTQYNCSAWTPNASTITTSTTVTQNSTCYTDQSRTRQDRELSSITGEVRNKGSILNEQQTLTSQISRPYTVAVTAWEGNAASSCGFWTPDPSSITYDEPFTQNGLNCSIPQTRTRTDSYKDNVTDQVVTLPTVTENQVYIATNGKGFTNTTRQSTGTKKVNVCVPYSTAYSWTSTIISNNPTTYRNTVVWNSELIVTRDDPMDIGSMLINGYSYTRNPKTICRIKS